MIVVSDSSPLIILSRGGQLDLLREFYGEVAIPREVHHEVTVAGAGLPGADEVRRAPWIRVNPNLPEPPDAVRAACAGLGAGERSAIYLASVLSADLMLIDEERARRVAKTMGFPVAGAIAVLERGARLNRVSNLRAVYMSLIDQGIRFDHKLLDASLARLGFEGL